MCVCVDLCTVGTRESQPYLNKHKKAGDDGKQHIETDEDEKTEKECPVCDGSIVNCYVGEK